MHLGDVTGPEELMIIGLLRNRLALAPGQSVEARPRVVRIQVLDECADQQPTGFNVGVLGDPPEEFADCRPVTIEVDVEARGIGTFTSAALNSV